MTELTTGQASPSIITLVFMVKNDLIPMLFYDTVSHVIFIFLNFFSAFSIVLFFFRCVFNIFEVFIHLFLLIIFF